MHAPPTTRAPLLWVLIPLILGVALARWTPHGWTTYLLGSGFAISALGLIGLSQKRYARPSYGLLFIGVIAISTASTLSQTPIFPREEVLPPREATLTLKITRLFLREDPYARQGGIARIQKAPEHLSALQGQKVSFFLKKQATAPSPTCGELWSACGVLDAFPPDAEPFSFAATQQNEGIYFSLNRGTFIEREHKASLISTWLAHNALWLKDILSRGTPPKALGVYTAMLLGDKQKLDPQTKVEFIQTGTLHLFAISGLHVGVIACALFALLRYLALPQIVSTYLGLLLLLLYVLTIGASPSALRAFLMICFLWGAYVFQRRPAPFSALVASALCVLLVSPLQLWNPGFQLSYSVVTGILLYGLPLAGFFKRRFVPESFVPASEIPYPTRMARWIREKVLESSAITLSATLFSAPLILAYFHMLSPGAFFLNLILIPLASFTIILGFASLICGLLYVPLLPEALNKVAALCIEILTQSVSWGLHIPYLFWEAKSRNVTFSLIGVLGLLTLLLYARSDWRQKSLVQILGPILFAILWLLIAIQPTSLNML